LITESLFSAAEYEGHDQTRGEPADVRHVGDSTPLRVLERRSVLAEYLRDYPQSQRHQSGNFDRRPKNAYREKRSDAVMRKHYYVSSHHARNRSRCTQVRNQ